jgi:hypothetical protein
MKTLTLAALAVLSLAGCTQPTVQAGIDQAYLAYNTCRKPILDKYAPVWAPHGATASTQSADETIPSAEEARLIGLQADELEGCRGTLVSMMSRVRPDVVPIWTQNFNDSTMRMTQFRQGKITWAENARRAMAQTQARSEALAAADQRNDQLRAQRLAAVLPVLQMMQQQNFQQQLLQQQQQAQSYQQPIYSNPSLHCTETGRIGVTGPVQMTCN